MLFNLANLGTDFDKPLTQKILSNPQHPVTKHILYLYSMECFIYEELNRASRTKDTSKIRFYGAYAAALSYVIYYANSNRKLNKLHQSTYLYRGLQMSQQDLDQYVPGSTINLLGYTSTSRSMERALHFALKHDIELAENDCDDRVPVLLQILFKGSSGLFEMTKDYSAYPDEQEVLV